MADRKQIEVMAPVGTQEALMAAIQGSADSVYFGVQALNMRRVATKNFTIDNLHEITKICRDNAVKSYLTVNTVIYDQDIALLEEILRAAKQAGIDAVIATDIATLTRAHQLGLEIHASTQLNITNIEAVRFYARYADVQVLARELTLEQVKYISEAIERENIYGPSGDLVRLELFVHGALCMAISGKCYLSLHESWQSANRGACRQTCRKAYTVSERDTGNQLDIDNQYIMSPKDLMTIGFLDKILDAGVRVLKIEGRARPPEYVKTVSRCYREAADAYLDNSYTQDKITDWNNRLKRVFNRGFWDGYYLGRRLGEWNKRYGSRATRRKLFIGQTTNYFKKIGVGEFLLQAFDIKKGDELLIIGPTTGVVEFTVVEMRLDEKAVKQAFKGDVISMPVPEVLRRSDKLYKLVEPGHEGAKVQ